MDDCGKKDADKRVGGERGGKNYLMRMIINISIHPGAVNKDLQA
jgi:hypothetical protein